MITTTIDMYELLLELYQRQKTGSVTVDEFNRRVNVAALNVIRSKLPVAEANQEIDDSLRTLTVSSTLFNAVPGNVQLALTPIITQNNYVNIHPFYLRMLKVYFKIKYLNNPCFEEGSISDWITAKKLRLDSDNDIKHDPFRKPSDEKPYYKFITQNAIQFIDCIINTQSTIVSVKLDYIKHPSFIFLDPLGIANQDSDLPSEIQQQIVYEMLRELLENTESPRVYKPVENRPN